MRLLDSLRFRVATLFQRSQIDAEMEDELRAHIEHRADDLKRSGFPRAEAERRARIEFGGHEKFKEECRETAGVHFFETLLQDVRFALHMLRKSPGFTAVAVATLALGICANAVVFGVMNALVLRPLSVPEPQSLYAIEPGRDKDVNHSYPDYLDLRDRNRSFEDLAAYNVTGVGLDTGNNPVGAWIMEVTGNYFDVVAFSRILAGSFTLLTSMGPTALHISCSPTRTGTPSFRMIPGRWAGPFSSTSIRLRCSVWRRRISGERFPFVSGFLGANR